MIHLEHLRDDVCLVRWYDGDADESFMKCLPYKAVATLLWHEDTVKIYGLHGMMTRQMFKALKTVLAKRGVRVVCAYRHGRWVQWMPQEEL